MIRWSLASSIRRVGDKGSVSRQELACRTRVPDLGDRFVKAIVNRIEALRDNSGKGRIVAEFDRPFVRELIHPPFRIAYRIEPKRVRIVRVRRGERLLSESGDEDE